MFSLNTIDLKSDLLLDTQSHLTYLLLLSTTDTATAGSTTATITAASTTDTTT